MNQSWITTLALLSAATAGCGSGARHDFGGGTANGGDGDSGTTGSSSGSPGLGVDASAPNGGSCGSATDRQGCACVAGAAPRACSTGPAGGTPGEQCTVGQQSCVVRSGGEGLSSATWGPCTGDAGACVVADAGIRPPDSGPITVGCPPLAVGAGHACAITASGGLKCWGMNVAGELGNGSIGSFPSGPVDVVGLSSGVKCVVAGEMHTCALTTAGGVKCWGASTGIGGIVAGTVLGSLAGAFGGADGGVSSAAAVPADVPGLTSGVVGLASGEFDTCAMLADGSLRCWGSGGEEETDPTTNYGPTPQSIAGAPSAPSAIQMADGFGCLLTAAGAVECWGGNTFGELGNGSTTPSATPVPVTGLGSGVTWLSAYGGTAACAVVAGGKLECWGAGEGQTGQPVPVDVPALSAGVTSVSVGGENLNCAIMTDGAVKCWSWDGLPRVGAGQPTSVNLASAVYVAANEECACALLASGKVYCWSPDGDGSPFADAGSLGSPCSGATASSPVEVVGF